MIGHLTRRAAERSHHRVCRPPHVSREDVSVIDKLTEAQLDEFREAFNSFDKVCAGCGMMMSM